MTLILLAYGSNLSHGGRSPKEIIRAALDMLAEHESVDIRATSRLYRTPAVPPGSGPDFVNGAAVLESDLAPGALIKVLHAVEAQLGRVRRQRWAPRVVDLDLLAIDDLVLPDRATEAHWRGLPPQEAARRSPGELILPHPRMAERAFVLVPLAEIAPYWRHPTLGLTVEEMLAALDPTEVAAVAPLPDP